MHKPRTELLALMGQYLQWLRHTFEARIVRGDDVVLPDIFRGHWFTRQWDAKTGRKIKE